MKVFNKVGVFVLLLFAVNVVAQETIAKDSLKRMLNGNITTVEKIDVLKKLAELERKN